ncbi:hypothetical protein ACWGLF_33585 [Streptomyces puniciscabiei]
MASAFARRLSANSSRYPASRKMRCANVRRFPGTSPKSPARRGVTGAITGARRPEQTADRERAARLELTGQELEFVAGDAAGE